MKPTGPSVRSLATLFMLVTLAAAAPAARAAVDAFIWFEDGSIKGESMDPKHMGWIEVSSAQLDQFRNAGIGSATGGAGAGKVTFHPFVITKKVDKASPKLFEAATKGKHFPNVTIEMRKAGGGQQEYLVIKLEDVLVSSYRKTGRPGDEGPEESVTFNFTKVSFKSPPPEPPRAGAGAQLAVGASSAAALIASPTITKVTPSAASATTGQVLTFPVEGTGDCAGSRIDFGDGTIEGFSFAAGKSQPAKTHAYSKAGTFEVRAYGLADPWAKLPAPPQASEHPCSGHAFANVSIRLPLAVAAPAVRK